MPIFTAGLFAKARWPTDTTTRIAAARGWVFLPIAQSSAVAQTQCMEPALASAAHERPPRTSAPASPGPSAGPEDQVLVVGYDGSPGSRETIAKAARRCDDRGRLVIVRTLNPSLGEPPTRADRGAYQSAVTSLLAAVRSELYPHVPYELRVVAGDLSSALADVVRRHHGAELVTGSPPSPSGGRPNPRTGAPLSRPPARVSLDKSHAQRQDEAHRIDTVEQSGLDSFPASDPPSWWAGHGAPTSEHP